LIGESKKERHTLVKRSHTSEPTIQIIIIIIIIIMALEPFVEPLPISPFLYFTQNW
jgi:hypothetical protein